MTFCTTFTTLEPHPVCHGAAAVPYCDSVYQQVLNGRAVEGQQQVGIQVVLPGNSQEVKLLLSLLDDHCDAVCPGEVNRDKNAKKPGGKVWTLSTHSLSM